MASKDSIISSKIEEIVDYFKDSFEDEGLLDYNKKDVFDMTNEQVDDKSLTDEDVAIIQNKVQ